MKKTLNFIILIFFIFYTFFIGCLLYGILVPINMNDNTIIIYDTNNKIIYQSDKSKTLDIEELDPFIKEAIITIEDSRFYSHIGFDIFRMGKAIYTNTKNQSIIEGGSTITQQFAKNMYLDNTQTLKRKISEFIYAIQLEMQYSKNDILEGYLNTIYYGHGIYGLKNASTFYFNKEINQLTKAEIALLIGIPNGPSYYSPFLSYDNAFQKRNAILKKLNDEKLINDKEYEKAIQEKITLNTNNYEKEDAKNYYIDCVLAQIEQLNIQGEHLYVYTYYDEKAQNALTSAIHNTKKNEEIQSAGVIMEPYTSNILAIQGGNDYTTSSYNRAIYAKRQIASTIKPLLYTIAIEQGFTPSSLFSSEPTVFKLENSEEYAPENYAKVYPYKEIPMVQALSMSDNIYAVKTLLFLGIDSLVNTLELWDIQVDAHPSLALGCVNLSPLQLTSIYNTFASEGFYIQPSFIHTVKDDTTIRYTRKMQAKQFLERDSVLVMNQLLTATYDNATKDYALPTMYGRNTDVKTGVKSGTSNWDTWVMGFNPYYTVGIWNGYDDNRNMVKSEYDYSKSIWQSTFNALMKDRNEVWYEKSDTIIEKRIDPKTGKEDEKGSVYWYLK